MVEDGVAWSLQQRYDDIDSDTQALYERVRCDDLAQSVETFDRLMETGTDMFYEQWDETYANDDYVEGKDAVPGAIYREPLWVREDADLADVGAMLEYSMGEEVYDSFREVFGAALRDDAMEVAKAFGGLGFFAAAIGAKAAQGDFSVDDLMAFETLLTLETGVGGMGAAVGADGWRNLHRKYSPQDVADAFRNDFPRLTWPASGRGTAVLEDARNSYYLLDPAEPLIDDAIEDAAGRCSSDGEARGLIAVLDPAPGKGRLWDAIDDYFPGHEFEDTAEVFGAGLAYTTGPVPTASRRTSA